MEGIARQRADIYFHRERPVESLDGLQVDLITITSSHSETPLLEKEPLLKGAGLLRSPSSSPLKFPGRKYIFLSGRVHPGEVAASHMLNGLLNYLIEDPQGDVRVELLLQNFVFVVIPFLNPDGVFRGHYRADTLGRNLNRMYNAASLEETPTLHLVNSVIGSLVEQ